MGGAAPGVRFLGNFLPPLGVTGGRILTFFFTLIIYTCYHLSRKPLSVVKSVFHANCTEIAEKHHQHIVPENATFCDWEPFNGDNYNSLFGTLDVIFLAMYAMFMFVSGAIADRIDLRIYLSFGTLLTGITTIAFGLGYFFKIHSFAFYLIVQLIAGIFHASGWPAVVACMGNWFGKSQRGLFMGLWNVHISLGNILGSLVAGIFVDWAWGWSFVVPGLIIGLLSVPIFLFLSPYPEQLGLDPPVHRDPEDYQNLDDSISVQRNMKSTENYSNDMINGERQLFTPDITEKQKGVPFLSALRVPGVIEYSLCLFFSKLVSYTFLFWLPMYIRDAGGFDPSVSADLSAVFDFGGIIGGILAGFISDRTRSSAITCVTMLVLAIPTLYLYSTLGFLSIGHCVGLLIPLGLLVNGPYGLITTAVSADLGTHESLATDSRALATVSGIIDGAGSVGAAFGPLLCGLLKPYGWPVIIIMLMVALGLAALLLLRRAIFELRLCLRQRSTPDPNPIL